MKRGLCILAALIMVMAVAGPAMAYFEDGELIRVVYDTRGGNEYASDLGDVTTLAGGSNVTVGGGADAIDLADFPGATWDDLAVAYYTKSTATQDIWATGDSATTAPVSGNRKWVTASSSIAATQSYYASLGSDSSELGATTAANGYWQSLDKNGINVGEFGGYYATGYGEASLSDLSTTGYVDLFLYYFDSADSPNPGTLVAVIRTLADGSTIINPVPIPASVLLLASGLLGMVGIRRKRAQAA